MSMPQHPEQRSRYLAKLLDIAHDGILVMDNNAVIQFWNGGAERLYGWSKEEAVGQRSHDLLRTQFPVPLEEIQRELHDHGEWNGELIHTKKDNVAITVSSRWVLMFDDAGQETGFLEVNRDISDTKRLQQSLANAQRMEALGRLAGGVAHDFNNLLTVILGYAAELRARLDAQNPLAASILEIERAASQAALVTGQLLAFSRKQVTRFDALDLNKVVDDIRDILARLVGEDIELHTHLDDSRPYIRGDGSQLTQVIMNLAANARDAMPIGGALTIETRVTERDQDSPGLHGARPAGKYAVLSVSDTGEGMDLITQSQIFEPFFTTKEVGKGTGLGLSTTHGIVSEHGGWIDVYSERGHGTVFHIFLPAVAAEARVAAPTPENTGPRRIGIVLLVEDQAAIRLLSQDILEDMGHRVLTAPDGRSALELAETEPDIDLLVTDVVMPEMSGPQLAQILTRIRPTMGVLYTSGYTGHALVSAGTLEQGTAFLNKPFTPEALAAKVDEVMSRGRTRNVQVA